MTQGDELEGAELTHTERQTKALERLVLLAEVWLFLAVLVAVVGGIAWFGN